MKAPDISSLLSEYGIPVSPKVLALLAVVLPLLVVFGKKLYPHYQTWMKKRLARAPQADHGAWNAVWQLRSTFRGFLGRLPRVYRRSILNFEHFVVLGAASSGKSTLLDTQTDWLYRTKEVAQDVTVDPELPTYLASGAIITELPARYLEDTGELSRRALNRLWRPLYRKRSPTVVAVVDTRWLSESTPDARRDLALALRMRVNQLSQLRRRPIEVRVALTRLEEMAGFAQAAKFWVDERISNRVPLPADSRSEASLEVWLQEIRAQLPRALQRLGASEFHGFIGFLRRIPDLLPPLAHFADVLFQAEPTSLPPIRGGAYLCSAVSGAESPLTNASESGPGPNVLRQHAVLAGVLATMLILYFAVAYRWESEKWTAAIDEFGKHHLSRDMIAKGTSRVVANGLEEGPRRVIRGFLEDRERFIARFPGFFSRGSDQIREAFLERVREDVLIPQIRKMAEVGAPTDGGTLRSRRAIHGLAILHSDRSDNFNIVANPGLLEWSSKMMQIPEDMIRDYIRSNTTRYVKPLTLAPFQEDEKDTAPYWLALPQEMANAVGDGVITAEELSRVQRIVERDERILVRFQNDKRTFEELLPKLQSNLGYEDLPKEDKERLGTEYDRTFRLVSAEYHANLLFQNADKLRAMMTLVTTSSKVVSANAPEFLVDLLSRLTEAEAVRRSPLPTHDPIVIELGGRALSIDARRWHDLVFQLGVERTIDSFIAKRERASAFFPPAVVERELRDLDWNPLATSGAPFPGSGLLKGSYTRTGYERWVRQPIASLAVMLDRLEVSPACKGRLAEFLQSEVKAYAREYSREVSEFQKAFRLNAPSPTLLGMVLEEMSGPNSIFDEFVAIIDENTDLSYGAELAGAAPQSAARGTASTADKASDAASAGPFMPESVLAPLREALVGFDAWHKSVGARGKRAEMTKYKAILKQLLTDLQAASTSEPSAAPREPEVLDKLLPPAGRSALGSLRSDPKSYDALARQWAADTGLTHPQQRPFLAPFDELWRVGRDDLQTTLTDAWQREMLPLLDSVSSKFPFDRRADAAVEPAELTRLFHPVDGEFSRLVARYVAPLSEEVKDGGWKPSASAAKRVSFPAGLYATVNAVSYLASRLWDSKGAPRPLTFRVVTVPFDAVAGKRLVPTAVTLKAGAMSVLNVNQKPQTSTLAVDWTGDDSAQLSLRVGDAETGEASYPAPLVASGPYFRFWRLLSLATRVDAERRGGAHLYEWRLRVQDGSDEKAPVHLEILDDPWSLFSIKRGGSFKRQ